MYEWIIKGRCEAYGLREHSGGAGVGDAVQGLAPPVIARNLQLGNRARLIHHLGCLLFQGHALDQIVDARIDWLGRIKIKRFVLRFTSREQKYKEDHKLQDATNISFHGVLLRRPERSRKCEG